MRMKDGREDVKPRTGRVYRLKPTTPPAAPAPAAPATEPAAP